MLKRRQARVIFAGIKRCPAVPRVYRDDIPSHIVQRGHNRSPFFLAPKLIMPIAVGLAEGTEYFSDPTLHMYWYGLHSTSIATVGGRGWSVPRLKSVPFHSDPLFLLW